MAEGTFVYAGDLNAGRPLFQEFTVGTGGVTKGDAVAIGTSGDVGKIVKHAGAAATAVLGVANDTVAAGGTCLVTLATEDAVFEAQAAATTGYVMGTGYDLTASTQLISTSTTNAHFKVLDDIRSADTVKKLNGVSRLRGMFAIRVF